MRRAAALVAGALLAGAGAAAAGPFEVEGFGPAGVAEVNARAARADDGTAAFYNPGGLGLGRGVRVELAPTLGVSALSAQGVTRPLEDPFGIALAFDATLPFTGALKDRLRVGFGGYLPPTTALRLVARPSDEPLFPYYDNRTQRLVLVPALAARITDRLAVGVGLNVLGGVRGPATVEPGASGAPESRLDLVATTQVAVHAGVRFDPAPGVHIGVAFRQRFAVPAVVTTRAVIGGVPLDMEVTTRSALYDPTTVVVAASADVGRATVELDASYAVWSAYAGPFVDVRAVLPGVNLESALPSAIARDVVSLRAAGTYRIEAGKSSEVVLRAGAGAEPRMLSTAPQGRTNLVDGDKILAGLGATVVLRAPAVGAIRFGLGANTQVLLPYAQDKRACASTPCPPTTVAGPDPAHPSRGIENPGYPRLEGHGAFWTVAFGVGVDR